MFRGNPIGILLLLILVHCCIRISSAKSLDYYYFSQQWPASCCGDGGGCCYNDSRVPLPYFGIHGLWPQFKDGTWPQYCNESDTFQITKVAGLMKRMHMYWNSFNCSSNNLQFWKHEWEKHGTCTPLHEKSYFKKTLALREKIDLLHILKSSGIVPDGSAYSVKKIKKAIKDGVGFEPMLNCEKISEEKHQLLEIYLCVSKKDASTLIKCPPVLLSTSCPFQIVFPHPVSYADVDIPAYV